MTPTQRDLQQRIHAAYEQLQEAHRFAATAQQRGDMQLAEHWQREASRRYDTCRNLMRQQR